MESFSEFDLRARYYHPTTNSTDISKIAFSTRYGYYGLIVMPICLANGVAVIVDHISRVSDPFNQVRVFPRHDMLIHAKDRDKHIA